MIQYIRKEEIIEYLKEKKVCSIEELQEKYTVSISTIHRDLNLLEREGRINKYYGKVAIKTEQNFYKSRIDVNVELKRGIAQKALSFIESGDCIFLDNSTTVYYLAEALCRSSFKNIIVVSNSAFISDLFFNTTDIDFIALGGKLHKDLNCYIGADAERVIKKFNGNKYFFSTSSISIAGGISDIYVPDENIIKVIMNKYSKVSYLLVDSTKFGKESTIKWFEISDVDHVITDSNLAKDQLRQFQTRGVEIITT